MEMKKCPQCGADLPAEAAFCPECMAILNERKTAEPPKAKKRRWPWLVLAAFIAAAVTAALLLHGRNVKVDNGTAQVEYAGYTVIASFNGNRSGVTKNSEKNVSLPAGSEINTITRVFVLDAGGNIVTEDFRALVESAELTLETLSGSGDTVDVLAWGVYDDFPEQAYTGEIHMLGADSTQRVVWTLHMKNGDTLALYQTLYVSEQQTITFTSEDTPMATAEELTALVKKIDTELDKNAIVEVYLPAGTYDCGLEIKGHAYNVYGAVNADGTPATVFTGTVSVSTEDPGFVELSNLSLRGSGGVGLDATAAVEMKNCAFEGFDTAVMVHNGAFVHPTDCAFRGNAVAMDFNTVTVHFDSPDFDGNTFEDNGTALLLESLPKGETLQLDGCVFRGNGTDIENRSTRGVDSTRAVFEDGQ